MTHPAPLVEITRGPFVESRHSGHAVVCSATGEIIEAWGDPMQIVLPRSSAKMIQALPLIESGAAKAFGLKNHHLALACASHSGAAMHTQPVAEWLVGLGLSEDALRCGPQTPLDRATRHALLKRDEAGCQLHNSCSGKHAGFLTLAQHLGAGPDYHHMDHPVQQACLSAFNALTEELSPGFGIDGCSAPNHAASLLGMARAMAFFAAARPDGGARSAAAARLIKAMTAYPELVAGEARACTRLMRAMKGKVAVKFGAEAFFVAVIPERKLGVALKITDGATRAAECAIAALLVRLGVLDAAHPDAQRYINAPILNQRRHVTGYMRPAAGLLQQ
ncbi:asparaginase [Cognatishimia sp. SS12]|uniref:asparaginase n=1 Tax=Cognatishimia sp. SS12 TaxID=2979465 RepID=UPI002330AE78|nr:asparaginase [Cognatishimia sp. SS12]MDC0737632.1 asparaginase [Cognatishimia sp. SS12]